MKKINQCERLESDFQVQEKDIFNALFHRQGTSLNLIQRRKEEKKKKTGKRRKKSERKKVHRG